MLWRSRIFFMLAGGAVLAPLFAFGHACEFLVARLETKPDLVTLEITADYGGNPLIVDEAAAREAVRSIFKVHSGGQVKGLEELSPLRMESRSQWDPATPASLAPPPDGQTHLLITGVWNWKPDADFMALAVPKKNLHDVLLWTRGEKLPGKDARWMLLIEGDKTPDIRVKPETLGPRFSSWLWFWLPVPALGLAGAWMLSRYLQRAAAG